MNDMRSFHADDVVLAPDPPAVPTRVSLAQRIAQSTMAACLAVMVAAVFVNVLLRYGFGSGVAAAEELSRLLFVWMVFIGATAAYPAGEHMAFTSLLRPLQQRPLATAVLTRLIHALVLLACAFIGWGAWQQVVVGLGSRSVVMGHPMALLPLPAMLCAGTIGVMALIDLVRGKPIDFGHEIELE
jgi:TRAP-type transport system small permease protein